MPAMQCGHMVYVVYSTAHHVYHFAGTAEQSSLILRGIHLISLVCHLLFLSNFCIEFYFVGAYGCHL